MWIDSCQSQFKYVLSECLLFARAENKKKTSMWTSMDSDGREKKKWYWNEEHSRIFMVDNNKLKFQWDYWDYSHIQIPHKGWAIFFCAKRLKRIFILFFESNEIEFMNSRLLNLLAFVVVGVVPFRL